MSVLRDFCFSRPAKSPQRHNIFPLSGIFSGSNGLSVSDLEVPVRGSRVQTVVLPPGTRNDGTTCSATITWAPPL